MTSLKVAVRVRPPNYKEKGSGSKIVLEVLGNDILVSDPNIPERHGYDHRSRFHRFSFDYGFSSVDPTSDQYASQATVFEKFGRVVLQALLEGYNCCVIAYGQSGSGKTYTMMGMKGQDGMTPRICEGLLMKLEDGRKRNISFAVNISYMEIYNEQVYDLLQKSEEGTSNHKSRLRVREHPVHGPFVEGLSTHILKSRDTVCQLISEGNHNRVKCDSSTDEQSSRSHAVFTVYCSQACLDESEPKEVISKLQLIDLAGSEKAGQEFCQTRLQEGANINKSLVALGNVISALVELSQRNQSGAGTGGRQLFVPYRDSQLTWLLKDTLGGNSQTFMLAAVSPCKECYSDTLSTLRYAQRAANIVSVPVVNEDPSTKIIRNLKLEVTKLRSQLVKADVLSREAVMKPLPNIAQLNSIMKRSEEKVDHLTKQWLEKWFKSCSTKSLEANGQVKDGKSPKSGIVHNPQENRSSEIDIIGKDLTVCGSYEEDTSSIAEDSKSSSTSSQCIVLPDEIVFYMRGRKSCSSNLKTFDVERNTTGNETVDHSIKNHVNALQATESPSRKNVFKSLPALPVFSSFYKRNPLLNCSSLPQNLNTVSCMKTDFNAEVQCGLETATNESNLTEQSICAAALDPDTIGLCSDNNEDVLNDLHSSNIHQQDLRFSILHMDSKSSQISPVDIIDLVHKSVLEDNLCCDNSTNAEDTLSDLGSNLNAHQQDLKSSALCMDSKSSHIDLVEVRDLAHESVSNGNLCRDNSTNAEVSDLSSSLNSHQQDFQSTTSCMDSEYPYVSPIEINVLTHQSVSKVHLCRANDTNAEDSLGDLHDAKGQLQDFESSAFCMDSQFSHISPAEVSDHTHETFSKVHLCSEYSTNAEDTFGDLHSANAYHQDLNSSSLCKNSQSSHVSPVEISENSLHTDLQICHKEFGITSNDFVTSKSNSMDEILFNESVAKESDMILKYLNITQGDSVETINCRFQKRDSEIMSLLSLSSNGNPPFLSLDDIFTDDAMEGSDEIDENGDSGNRSWTQRSWNQNCWSSGVSEISDADSDFDYVDFTTDRLQQCPKSSPEEYFRHVTESQRIENENREMTHMNKVADTSEMNHQGNLSCIREFSNEHLSNLCESNLCENMPLSHSNDDDGFEMKKLCDTQSSSGTSSTLTSRIWETESFTSSLLERSVPVKKLYSSYSVLITPRHDGKFCSKSDNIICAECRGLLIKKISFEQDKAKKNTVLHNSESNEIPEKSSGADRESIYDLVDISMQHILDKINYKGGKLPKNQEEERVSENSVSYEIQKFIDNTEITDAYQLADELLKKRLSKSPELALYPRKNSTGSLPDDQHGGSELLPDEHSTHRNSNDNFCESSYKSLEEDSEYMIYKEKSSSHDLQRQNSPNTENVVFLGEQGKNTKCSPTEDCCHQIKSNIYVQRVELEDYERLQHSMNLNLSKDSLVTSEIKSEEEITEQSFPLRRCKEFPLAFDLGRDGGLGNLCDLDGKIKERESLGGSQSVNSTQASAIQRKSAHLDFVLPNSHFCNTVPQSDEKTLNDFDVQSEVYEGCNPCENFNISSLTPIKEESNDDSILSDVSDDESPNISFQFDSLERPKATVPTNVRQAYSETLHKTSCSDNSNTQAGQIQQYGKVLNECSYNNPGSSIRTVETESKSMELSDADHYNSVEYSKKLNKFRNKVDLPTTPMNVEEGNVKNTENMLCETRKQYRLWNVRNNEEVLTKDLNNCNVNVDLCSFGSKETDQNVPSFNNNLESKAEILEDDPNLLDPSYYWDSSSSTSSDSITFVFVGKENKENSMPDTNTRSVQSSLFSSVSLDSLEKSSVVQNQVACISPRTLSIDSLVAEELLFQLRNSEPVQPLLSDVKPYVDNQGKANKCIVTNYVTAPKRSDLENVSHQSCNQSLELYRPERQCNQKSDNDFKLSDGVKSYEQSDCYAVSEKHTKSLLRGNGSSRNSPEKLINDQKEKFAEACEEKSVQPSNYLKPTGCLQLQSEDNDECYVSGDLTTEDQIGNYSMTGLKRHMSADEKIFNTFINDCTAACHNDTNETHDELGNLSRRSSKEFNDMDIAASTQNLEYHLMNINDDSERQIRVPENICSKTSYGWSEYGKGDYYRNVIPVKELTEENLKMFNMESEESQGEILVLPPPSTFCVSQENSLHAISNTSSFSVVQDLPKTPVAVFSRSTQTDESIPGNSGETYEKTPIGDSCSTDLMLRMMDLMTETIKLLKRHYSRTPKKSTNQTRRKLHFSSESDDGLPDEKQSMSAKSGVDKKGRHLPVCKVAGSKAARRIHSAVPVSEKRHYDKDISSSGRNAESWCSSQKAKNDEYIRQTKKENLEGKKMKHLSAKEPNFYTLPFDFITCKYPLKKLSKQSELMKPDAGSCTNVNCLSTLASNSGMVMKDHTIDTMGDLNELNGMKEKENSSKKHLKDLIEVRRKVVEATMNILNREERKSHENDVTDSLNSTSSSSEGYLSSVSSKGPLRQISEISTDSQGSSHATFQRLPKNRFQKSTVAPPNINSQNHTEAASPNPPRWLNTSADSGAFFLDSPGTEKKAQLDESPTAFAKGNGRLTDKLKTLETEKYPLGDGYTMRGETTRHREQPVSSTRISLENGVKKKAVCNENYAPGFHYLDTIGQNYMDIPLREHVPTNTHKYSNVSVDAERNLKNITPTASGKSKTTLKRLSSCEIETLLDSIEADRKLLEQLQNSCGVGRKHLPFNALPSCRSPDIIDDLFYWDCYKSLPSTCAYLSSSLIPEV